MARTSRLRRLAGKALKRAANLPRGASFFTYARNRIAYANAIRRRAPKLPHPTSIMLEVTNLCQLRCITCPREYELGREMDKGHMDIGRAKDLIDRNHVYLDSMGLTGLGETLLYPHLVELVDHIRMRNSGIHIFISTNAHQANAPELADRLADKIDALQISIDGCGEVFEKVRRNANWEGYIENVTRIVETCRGRRADPKMNMVVLRENAQQMAEVVRAAHSVGVREVYFNTVNLVANDWDTAYYGFYGSDGFRRPLGEAMAVGSELGLSVDHDDLTQPRSFSLCPFPWNHFYVTWDGYLVPCCAKPFPKEKHFGNVFEKDLLSCVNDPGFREFRQLWTRAVAPGFCWRCHFVTGPGE
jgi:MoaA/NifB/PqqE/SkfB family radical SAM enzyme